jgi:hypothetical protein
MGSVEPTGTPGFSYLATSRRPGWSQLPIAVREAVAERLGGAVVSVRSVGGGFTPGFAAIVVGPVGRAFVKAAPLGGQVARWYAREGEILAALPDGVPAPELLWSVRVDDYVVVGAQVIDGVMPAYPWTRQDLDASLEAVATTAQVFVSTGARLRDALALPGWDSTGQNGWRRVAAGVVPMPPGPGWLTARLPELVALEARLEGYGGEATTLSHNDLRLDNVVIDARGVAWLTDWNHLRVGPAWFDTVSLLFSAFGQGHDLDRLFTRHPTALGAPGDAVDAALAGIGGYYSIAATRDPWSSGSAPRSRPTRRP